MNAKHPRTRTAGFVALLVLQAAATTTVHAADPAVPDKQPFKQEQLEQMLAPIALPSLNIHMARARLVASTLVFAMVAPMNTGCTTQATFDSANKAVDSLVAAVCVQDTAQIKHVRGAQSEDILSSGDKVADTNRRNTFLSAYDEKHQLVAGAAGSMTFVVGKSDWPMPIPIMQVTGKWRFDTAAAKEEILNRRIGRDELSAIETCPAVLDAQREYVAHDRTANGLHKYAAQFFSEPGKRNGLYWPTAENEPASPLGPLVAAVAEDGYKPQPHPSGTPQPFNDDCFRILTSQGPNAPGESMDYMVDGKLVGGFALVAWPATYGNSGIMTFIMNHDGIVYQRDLRDETPKVAEAMSAYDPSPEWEKVEPGK